MRRVVIPISVHMRILKACHPTYVKRSKGGRMAANTGFHETVDYSSLRVEVWISLLEGGLKIDHP